MANINNEDFARRFINTAGEQFVTCQTSTGEIFRARKPMFDDGLAYAEQGQMHQAAVRDAATYASFASTQDVYICKAKATGGTAYSLAFTDWFSAPRVLEINVDGWTGRPGQTIRVKARDNLMVARVVVRIRNQQGKVMEKGEAVQRETGSAWWIYTTRSHLSMSPFPAVEATAYDLPGNSDTFTTS